MVGIKNIEMPISCSRCPIIYIDREDNEAYCAITGCLIQQYQGRDPSCPLIELENN